MSGLGQLSLGARFVKWIIDTCNSCRHVTWQEHLLSLSDYQTGNEVSKSELLASQLTILWHLVARSVRRANFPPPRQILLSYVPATVYYLYLISSFDCYWKKNV